MITEVIHLTNFNENALITMFILSIYQLMPLIICSLLMLVHSHH